MLYDRRHHYSMLRGNRNVLYGGVILFTFACWLAKSMVFSLTMHGKKQAVSIGE
jgi:hypothetical protein